MSDDLTIPSPTYRPPRRQRRGLDPETKRRLIFAGGIAGAVFLLGGAIMWLGGGSGEVPVIQADSRPIRVKPDNPGGMQVAGANNEIYGDGDSDGTARLAPAAETPNPAALLPVPRVEPRPTPDPASRAAAVPAGSGGPVTAGPTPRQPAESARPPVVGRQGTEGLNPPAANQAMPGPARPGTQENAGVARSPLAQPRVAPSQPAAAQPALARPAVSPPAVSPPAEQRRTSGVSVQLAAVGSEDGARGEWRGLSRRMPELLGNRQPNFIKAERNGKTFWRVRTAGFADVGEARAFCDRVKTKGAACTVAQF